MSRLSRVEEELVEDLVSEYSDRVQAGEDVSMDSFLARCPNEPARKEFAELAGMSMLLDLNAEVRGRRRAVQ